MSVETAPPRTHSPAARFLIVVLLIFIGATALLWYAGALTPRPRIALVTASDSGIYWEMLVRGAEDAAERYKVNLTVLRPSADEPSQTAAIQNLLGQRIDRVEWQAARPRIPADLVLAE